MSLREEIEARYLDRFGFVTPRPDHPAGSGNGLLYTSTYLMILFHRHEVALGDIQRMNQLLTRCEIQPFIFSRAPGDRRQQGPDDYIGVLCFWAVFNPDEAHLFLCVHEEGVRAGPFRLRFYLNNEVPGTTHTRKGELNLSAWMGRQLHLVALIYWAAGKKPPILNQLAWFISIAGCGLWGKKHWQEGGQDTWIKSWLMVSAIGEKTLLTRLASKIFHYRLQRVWGRGMRDVFNKYFTSKYGEHPFAKYVKV